MLARITLKEVQDKNGAKQMKQTANFVVPKGTTNLSSVARQRIVVCNSERQRMGREKPKVINTVGNKTYHMVEKITNNSVLQLFLFDYGRRLYLREMGKLLGRPHQTLMPHLKGLKAKSVLLESNRGKITEFRLNWNNPLLTFYLAEAELSRTIACLEQSALLRLLAERLKPSFATHTFVIFGSAAVQTGAARDIDLLVVGQGKVKALDDFEVIYSKKLHTVQVGEIAGISKALQVEVFKKHLLLNNVQEVVMFFSGVDK